MATFRVIPTYKKTHSNEEALREEVKKAVQQVKVDFKNAMEGLQSSAAPAPVDFSKFSPLKDERVVSFDAGDLKGSLGRGMLHIHVKSGELYVSLDETAINRQGKQKRIPVALQEFEASDGRGHYLLRDALLDVAGYSVEGDTAIARHWLECQRATAKRNGEGDVEEYIRYAKRKLKANAAWYWERYRDYTKEFFEALTIVMSAVQMVPLKEDVRHAFHAILGGRGSMDECGINDAFKGALAFTGFEWLPNSLDDYPSEVLESGSDLYKKAIAQEGGKLCHDIFDEV